MQGADTAKRNGRRAKATKEESVETTADKSVELDNSSTAKKSESKAKAETSALAVPKDSKKPADSSIALSPMGSAYRPVGPGAIEVASTYTSSGDRPIAVSHMAIYGTILNNRPIMSSDIHVLNTTPVGGRPIFSSGITVRDDLTLPGGRPIFASDPKLMEASLLPGGRPIASNEGDDSEMLMGYID